MNRRGFLSRLGAAAIGLRLAERLGLAPKVTTLSHAPWSAPMAFKAGDVIKFKSTYLINPLTEAIPAHVLAEAHRTLLHR